MATKKLKFSGPVTTLLCLCSLGIGGIGGYTRLHEDAVLSRAHEVTALIESVQTESIRGGRKRGTKYRPVVHYRFEYDGTWRESSRVTISDFKSDEAWADEIANRFASQSMAVAWVDPEDPEVSYLVQDRHPMSWFFIGLGGTMFLVSLAGYCIQRRRGRDTKASGSVAAQA